MSEENVIKEAKGADGRIYRLRLVEDYHADMPYDDGSVPLWRINYAGLGWRAEQVEMTSYDAAEIGMSDAVNRFGDPTHELLKRWLKAFRGVSIVEVWHSGESWYITTDPKAWRDEMGVTVEQLASESEEAGSLMAEYKAWCAGDVHGYVIESKVTTYTVITEPADGEIIGTRRDVEWRDVVDGTQMGLYGYDAAAKVAEAEFDAYLYRINRQVNASSYESITLVEPS